MSEFFLVRDDGFHPHDAAQDGSGPVVLSPDTDPASLDAHLDHALIAIEFPAMTDGRGFTLARLLREKGYQGRLRAAAGKHRLSLRLSPVGRKLIRNGLRRAILKTPNGSRKVTISRRTAP